MIGQIVLFHAQKVDFVATLGEMSTELLNFGDMQLMDLVELLGEVSFHLMHCRAKVYKHFAFHVRFDDDLLHLLFERVFSIIGRVNSLLHRQ